MAYVYRFIYWFKKIPREIKWFYQRGTRGWADYDAWSIDCYVAKIIPPMVRKIMKDGYGTPFDLTEREWHNILKKIAHGFEAYLAIDDAPYTLIYNGDGKKKKALVQNNYSMGWRDYKIKTNDKLKRKLESEYKSGMELFVKHFGNLWD